MSTLLSVPLLGKLGLELEGGETKKLGSVSREMGIDKVIGKRGLSLWRCLQFRREGKVSLPGRCYIPFRQVNQHGERYPVPEEISWAGGDLW